MVPSPAVLAALATDESVTSDDKAPPYMALLANLSAVSTPATATDDLCAIADSFFGAGLGVVAVRAVLAAFLDALRAAGNHDGLWVRVGTHVLPLIMARQQQQVALADQAAALRELVAEAHEEAGDYVDAARTLAEVLVDAAAAGGGRMMTDTDRARLWVRVARNYLEADDAAAAETYVNKLKNVMHDVPDTELQLNFRLCQARIQDAKREFLPASASYYLVSLSPDLAEDERLLTLGMAVKCVVLAPAGPLRSRALAQLYRDDRTVALPEFAILESMFMDRLLSPAEAVRFAATLQPHQLARTADGSTVVARAVAEHNLLGASRLYRNIGFDALAVLLGVDPARAEETTARMMEQGRLPGRIDQVDRIVWFELGDLSGENGTGSARGVVAREVCRWDANVQGLAEELENIANMLQQQFPAFAVKNLAV